MSDAPFFIRRFAQAKACGSGSPDAIAHGLADTGRCGREVTRSWASIAVAVLVFASVVRLADLGERSLTHDEAWRANWSHHGGADEILHFPPLQFLLGCMIQHGIGRSEFVLRLPYALAGIACVIILYEFTRRTIDGRSAVFVAAVVAVHPVLVAYSRVFKVFGLEAMMSALLVWAGFATFHRFTRRNLLVFLAVAITGLGLTFTSSLLIAAWTPLLIWSATRGDTPGDNQRASPGTLLWVLGVIFVFGIGWYCWLSGSSHTDRFATYHEHTFHVWPESYAAPVLLHWFLRSAYGAIRYALGMELVWSPLSWVIGTAELLVVGASIGVLWRRARVLLCFVPFLFFVTALAAALRQWPLAALHTSTFLVPPVAIAVGCGLAAMVGRLGRSIPTAMLLAVCLFIPAARAVKASIISVSKPEHVRPVLEYVSERKQPGDAVFVYYAADDAFEFYWRDATVPVLVQPRSDRGHVERFTERFDRFIADHGRVWLVFAKDWDAEQADYVHYLTGRYRLLDACESCDASGHLFENHVPPPAVDDAHRRG